MTSRVALSTAVAASGVAPLFAAIWARMVSLVAGSPRTGRVVKPPLLFGATLYLNVGIGSWFRLGVVCVWVFAVRRKVFFGRGGSGMGVPGGATKP